MTNKIFVRWTQNVWIAFVNNRVETGVARTRLDAVGFLVDKLLLANVPLANSVEIVRT